MCALTIVLLLFPGTTLDALWKLNPEARVALRHIGNTSILLMLFVGAACAFAAVGLWQSSRWGVRLAIAILSTNILGDLLNYFIRHDSRALIGIPIGGLMIACLVRYHRVSDRHNRKEASYSGGTNR